MSKISTLHHQRCKKGMRARSQPKSEWKALDNAEGLERQASSKCHWLEEDHGGFPSFVTYVELQLLR